MSAIVVDTSSWIAYFKGVPYPAIDDALQEGRLYLPAMVAAELTSGQIPPAKKAALMDFLRELPLVDYGLEHWFRVGELRQKAARKGLNISMPDAHVAQCCLDVKGQLVSEDKVFKKLREFFPELFLA